VQTNVQVKLNCSKGSRELSGEQSEELSAQHQMRQFAIDDMRLSIVEREVASGCHSERVGRGKNRRRPESGLGDPSEDFRMTGGSGVRLA
jgi:hypothetical protein